jgi:hypothetical protein
MKAVAIKKGQTRERAPAFKEMGTLRCDSSSEEFIVFQYFTFVDTKAAVRQAQWLEKVLAEEHERERKHPDRIQLPDSFPTGGFEVKSPVFVNHDVGGLLVWRRRYSSFLPMRALMGDAKMYNGFPVIACASSNPYSGDLLSRLTSRLSPMTKYLLTGTVTGPKLSIHG